MAGPLGEVSSACRRRLTSHYGPAADVWLDSIPATLTELAQRWRVDLLDYHDTGCASVIAVARTSDGEPAMMKAWYDRSRYAYEVSALRAWPSGRVPAILHRADDVSVAALECVGGRPGGAHQLTAEIQVDEAPTSRRSPDERTVAEALAELHTVPPPSDAFPHLDEYLWTVVLPRIERRLRVQGGGIPDRCHDAVMNLDVEPRPASLLHADLYRENVLFDRDGRPVFIDPLPMVGDAAFDWAFWIVYYDLSTDPVPRLHLAAEVGGVPAVDVVNLCLTLCVDGLLYYREVGDPRASRMLDVMTALASRVGAGAPC